MKFKKSKRKKPTYELTEEKYYKGSNIFFNSFVENSPVDADRTSMFWGLS